MRDTFVKTLVELAKEDKNIELITGDLGFGVLKPFWEQCPDQFTNAGIAEQNMTTVAAGMALEGKTVFTYSIGNFPTLRCLEQIRNDCAYHNANVKVVCVGGGFVYGSLGMSHQATEDLAILRALPDVVVMAPADLVEAEECTKALADYKGILVLYIEKNKGKAFPMDFLLFFEAYDFSFIYKLAFSQTNNFQSTHSGFFYTAYLSICCFTCYTFSQRVIR